MKEVVQMLILYCFVVGLISAFILNGSTGLAKDMKDIKTNTLNQFSKVNTSLVSP